MDIQMLKRWRALELNRISSASAVMRLESEMERMTSRYSALGSGGIYADSSKIPAQLARLEELREKHSSLILECEELQGEILGWLKVLMPEERQLVEYRYREGKSWQWISLRMNYSKASLFRIQERALRREVETK